MSTCPEGVMCCNGADPKCEFANECLRDQLEFSSSVVLALTEIARARIAALEAALRGVMENTDSATDAHEIARAALEGE